MQLPDPNWESVQLGTPARLNILIKQSAAIAMPGEFQVVGAGSRGEELRETIDSSLILWLPTCFHITTQNVFSRFDCLEALDVTKGSVEVYISDLQITDISQQLGWEGQAGEANLPTGLPRRNTAIALACPPTSTPPKPTAAG